MRFLARGGRGEAQQCHARVSREGGGKGAGCVVQRSAKTVQRQARTSSKQTDNMTNCSEIRAGDLHFSATTTTAMAKLNPFFDGDFNTVTPKRRYNFSHGNTMCARRRESPQYSNFANFRLISNENSLYIYDHYYVFDTF